MLGLFCAGEPRGGDECDKGEAEGVKVLFGWRGYGAEALFEVAGVFGHAEGEEGGRGGGLGEDMEDGFAVGGAFCGRGVF